MRTSPDGIEHILTVTNVSQQRCHLEIPLEELYSCNSSPELESTLDNNNYWYDLIGNRGWRVEKQKISLILHPYDVIWLVPYQELERNIERQT